MASASEGHSTASAEQEDTARKEDERGSSEEQQESQESAEQSSGSAEASGESGEESSGSAEASGESGEGSSGSAEASGESGEESAESGEEEDGAASGRSMARAIDDVSSLPGETVSDQDGRKIGEVKEIYAVGEDETPMWVTIESATGIGRTRALFVPLARIKRQHDELRIPYSFDHIHDSPELEAGDEISEEDDRALRGYYGIGTGDQELVQSARSYASQVPDGEGSASKIDADSAEGPARELDKTPPAKRVAEAYEKQKEEEGEEHRKGRDATAEQIFEEDGADSGKSKDEDSDGSESSESKSEDSESEGPKAEEKSNQED